MDEPREESSSKDLALFNEKKAVSLTPQQMKAQIKREQEIRGLITDYIKENLKDGVDFGRIEIKGKMSKPTLFKPGSEKFFSLFKIRPTFEKDNETLEMLGNKPGIIAYVCKLVDGKGQVIGEGRGVAVADVSAGDFNVNKQVK